MRKPGHYKIKDSAGNVSYGWWTGEYRLVIGSPGRYSDDDLGLMVVSVVTP